MEEFCDFELMTSIMQQNCQIIDIKTVHQEPEDEVELFEWYKMVELFYSIHKEEIGKCLAKNTKYKTRRQLDRQHLLFAEYLQNWKPFIS